jgi:glycosyltransferase involved in cell wall biosynthesis
VVRAVKDRIDLFVVPEPNRAAQLVALTHLDERRLRILYNCKRYDMPPLQLPYEDRNGKLLHQGTIFVDEEPWTYLYEDPARYSMDIYGIIRRKTFDEQFPKRFHELGQRNPELSYLGKVTEKHLDELRPRYSYAVVYWHPSDWTQRFACPNKFFEAIASGVPPLCSPNPQMFDLVRRYDCGVLMSDWTAEAFKEAYQYAMEIRGTGRYAELVRNCTRAYETELNWPQQFAKIESILRPALGLREAVRA